MLNYHDLSDTQFENIVVSLGQFLFGVGLIGFSKGKDGGRDAKFVGTAQHYPSNASPWKECTIIQAKHTNGINTSFSDKAFYNPDCESGIIYEELQRITKLVQSGEMQNYLLVSNRKLSAITENKIRIMLAENTGLSIEQIGLAGIEQLNTWFTNFPEAKRSINVNPLEGPLIVDPDEMAKTIEAFSEVFDTLDIDLVDLPVPRTTYEEKMSLNNMSIEFSKKLRHLYLPLTKQIAQFLSDPRNEEYRISYQEAAEEFSLKIIEKQKNDDLFDGIFNFLVDLLVDRSSILKSNKRLTRAMLFYMYWNCDIGKNKYA